MRKPVAIAAASMVLAAGSGFLVAAAIGQSGGAPTKTVTIDVGRGERGPAGPAGPAGPKGDPGDPGARSCPAGSTFTAVVVNGPGGQTTLWTCVRDG